MRTFGLDRFCLACLVLALSAGCLNTSREIGPGGKDTSEPDVAPPDSGPDAQQPDATGDTGPDPCFGSQCGPLCDDDGDCEPGDYCLWSDDGCCSWCEEKVCQSDEDCDGCMECVKGTCTDINCVSLCKTQDDCGPEQYCLLDPDGCCGVCLDKDPCAEIVCGNPCDKDGDCSPGQVCGTSHDGCCSECVDACSSCVLQSAKYCAVSPGDASCDIPALEVQEVGSCWFEAKVTGGRMDELIELSGCEELSTELEGGECDIKYELDTDTFTIGCIGCGPVVYKRQACDCTASCGSTSCGDDGCGGTCGACGEGTQCVNGVCVADGPTTITPLCAHVPRTVGEGEPLPIALYGETNGCLVYEGIQTTQAGMNIIVTVVGKDPTGGIGCVSCTSSFAGIVLLDPLPAGKYTVTVASTFTFAVDVVTGQSPMVSSCPEVCPDPSVGDANWALVLAQSTTAPESSCNAKWNVDSELDFKEQGSCKDFLISSAGWPYETNAVQCPTNHIKIGNLPKRTDATACDTSDSGTFGHVILGVHNGDLTAATAPEVFLIVRQN